MILAEERLEGHTKPTMSENATLFQIDYCGIIASFLIQFEAIPQGLTLILCEQQPPIPILGGVARVQ